MNSKGERSFRELWGLSVLYSSLHDSILFRASVRELNQFRFKHSSLSFPWKLSTKAFSMGFPGLIKKIRIPFSYAQEVNAFEVNSGPLSVVITSGAPRVSTNL